MGDRGEMGQPGSGAYYVERTTYCAGEVLQGGVVAFAVAYQVVEYANGDVLVSCELRDTDGTFSSTRYWDAGQVGASEHGCTVAREDADVPGAYGYWDFYRDSQGHLAVYVNPSSGNDGFIYPFAGDLSVGGCDVLER